MLAAFAAACAQSGSSPPRGSRATVVVPETARTHFQRTVPTRTETRLALHVQPYAKCSVPGAGTKYYADADGLLQLFTRATRSDAVSTLLLDCVDREGRPGAYALDVLAKDGATPPDEPRDRIESTLAPLEGDLRAITDREIAQRGFPPRPDPDKAPGPYARWERLVSRPWSKVASQGVPMEGHLNGGAVQITSALNWSGAIAQASSPLLLVQGDWTVPTIGGPGFDTASSLWVGLDGNANNPDGSSDLIQCGTRQNSYYNVEDANEYWDYYAWVEYMGTTKGGTNEGAEQRVFTVDTHDEINADAWACDSEFNEDAHGGFGCFFIADLTLNLVYSGPPTPIPAGVSFSGRSAEWIMEAPVECVGNLNNCNNEPLSNFGWIEITNPWANGPATNGNVFASAEEVWMKNASGNTLSQGFVLNNAAGFQWVAFY
jgi:hypothetical protein